MHRMTASRSQVSCFVIAVVISGLSVSCRASETDNYRVETEGIDRIARAFRDRESDVVVEASGTVERVLSDDLQFPRHQRFILRIAPNHTLLVAHNIDLAPRVPVEPGSRVAFRGEYEWNDQGGVVHWTHHDPENRRDGGWIEIDGKRYR